MMFCTLMRFLCLVWCSGVFLGMFIWRRCGCYFWCRLSWAARRRIFRFGACAPATGFEIFGSKLSILMSCGSAIIAFDVFTYEILNLRFCSGLYLALIHFVGIRTAHELWHQAFAHYTERSVSSSSAFTQPSALLTPVSWIY